MLTLHWFALCSLFLDAYTSISASSSPYVGEWTSPPSNCLSDQTVDGPLLGNGDIGSFGCAAANNLTFYFGTNSFWYFGGSLNKILAVGGISFTLPTSPAANASSKFYLQQNALNGTVRFAIGNYSGDATVAQSASVPNILIIEFDAITAIQSKVFCAETSAYASTHYGSNAGIEYCQRITNASSTIVNATAVIAYASKYFPDRKRLVFVFSIRTNFNLNANGNHSNIDSNAAVIANATGNVQQYLNSDAIDAIYASNRAELQQFWSLSNISLPNEPLVEAYWYKQLYLQYMANRESAPFAPGLWAVWIATDEMGWSGDYTLNYNFESPYYGIYTANRISLASRYYDTILQYVRTGRGMRDAAAYNCSGIHYPAHIAPLGFNNSGDWGQHTSASFAALNFVQHFKYTQDETFLTDNNYEIYRYLYNVTEWWLCWTSISWDDSSWQNAGGYVDNGDCARENCSPDRPPLNVNPAIGLAFMQYIVDSLLNMTEILGAQTLIDADVIAVNDTQRWEKMSASISPMPIGVYDDAVVLLPQSVPYYFRPGDNPLQFYAIHPGNQIGVGSSSKLMLEIARNTINKTDTWIQNNCLPETYPAAVRCGYDINVTLQHFRELLTERMPPNGYVRMGGGGMDCSGAILAVNEMLLMSWDGITRIFAVYDFGDAEFHQLRAVGAFLVSAKMSGGRVLSPIYVHSEAGKWFNFQRPKQWNIDAMSICTQQCGKQIAFSCAQEATSGADICSFATTQDTDYEIRHTNDT